MAMIDEVLFEFRGQLSLNDIYNMTYKELGYLREHRHQLLSNKDVQTADAAQTLMGM